ncbi:hypothetical protein D3C78_843260 [compost metagenome]
MVGIATQAGNGLIFFIINCGLIVKRQIAETPIAPRVLRGKAEFAGAVLITPVNLPAFFPAQAAVCVRGVNHPIAPEFDDGPCAAQRQLFCRFAVPLKRQPVRQAVTIRPTARRRTIVKILNAIIASQAAQRHRAVAQPLLQQFAGDIKRHGRTHLTSQRIGGDQHSIPGTVDIRQIGQRKRTRL